VAAVKFEARYCANLSILFTEIPFEERAAAAAHSGFQSVEMWWPFSDPVPETRAVDALLRQLERAGVELRAMNFFAGDMAAGDRGVASRPDRQVELRDSIPTLIRIAQETECRLFNLLYGQLDDRWSENEQQQTAVTAIADAAGAVKEINGTVLLEPLAAGLNGRYPLTSAQQIVDLLTEQLSTVDNVELLFDTFHLASNGFDVLNCASRYAPYVRHVQLADAPGRGEPGTGRLPFKALIDTLDHLGYAGWLGCEYKLSTSTEDSLSWLPIATG